VNFPVKLSCSIIRDKLPKAMPENVVFGQLTCTVLTGKCEPPIVDPSQDVSGVNPTTALARL
jgi:hypothetical protein